MEKHENRHERRLAAGSAGFQDFFPVVNDYLDSPVVILDPAGRVVYRNSSAINIVGDEAGVERRPFFWDLYCNPEEVELYRAFFSLLDPGQYPLEVESTIPGKDSQVHTIVWKYNAYTGVGEKLKYHVLTGTDITAYRESNHKLLETGEKYRALIHVSPVSVITVDPSLRIMSWSSAAERLLGWTEKSVLGESISKLLNGSRPVVQEYCRKALTGEMISNLEISCRCRKGSPVEINLFMAPLRDRNGEFEGILIIALDITGRKAAEKELRESEKKYREILSSMEEGYYEVDLHGNLIGTNRAAARMLGYEEDELAGINYKEICANSEEVFQAFNRAYLEDKPQFSLITSMIRKDGSTCSAELSLSLFRNHEGEVQGFRGLGRDVTERVKTEEQLRYLSYHDALTGLYNRTCFDNEMERLEKSRCHPLAIILVDIDCLKLVNDSLGHKEGDLYLTACAGLLQSCLRGSDLLARLGGDEFALVLPQTGQQAAEKTLARLQAAIDEYNRGNPLLPLGISVGMAVSENSSQTLEETFRRADSQMYENKQQRSKAAGKELVRAIFNRLAGDDNKEDFELKRALRLRAELGEKLNLSERELADMLLPPGAGEDPAK